MRTSVHAVLVAILLVILNLVYVGLFEFEYVQAHRLVATIIGGHGFRTVQPTDHRPPPPSGSW